MKKVYVLLMILMGFSNIVHAADDEYPYSQRILDEPDPALRVFIDGITDARDERDLDRLRELCTELRETYTEVEDLLQYLKLYSRASASMSNFRPRVLNEMRYQSELAFKHIDSVLDGKAMPPVLLPNYWGLREGRIAFKYPMPSYDYWKVLPDTPLDEVWEARRRDVTECFLEVLGNVEQAKDPRWVDGRFPNVPMPRVSSDDLSVDRNVYTGYINPDEIRDPELRQEYIDALAKKKQVSFWWGVQRDLRTMEKVMPRRIDPRIAYMYSQKPDNVDELRDILLEYKISPEASYRILSAVAKKRGEPVPHRVLSVRPSDAKTKSETDKR